MKIGVIVGSILSLSAVAAVVVLSAAKEKALEKETSAFVTDTVNAISEAWKPEELVSRAEPGLIKAMAGRGQSVADLFAVYRKLGSLKSEPNCRFKDTSQFADYVTASYSCAAQYDNGPATLLITARQEKTGDEWKVYYINISSPYFGEGDGQTK